MSCVTLETRGTWLRFCPFDANDCKHILECFLYLYLDKFIFVVIVFAYYVVENKNEKSCLLYIHTAGQGIQY